MAIMTTPLPADIAADLAAHEIDPADALYIDRRSPWGGDHKGVKLPGKPVREAVQCYPGDNDRGWRLKVGGRYVGGVFPSAGAALTADE